MILNKIFEKMKAIQVADIDLLDIRLSNPLRDDPYGDAPFPYVSVMFPLEYQEPLNRNPGELTFTVIIYYRQLQDRTDMQILKNQSVCLELMKRYMSNLEKSYHPSDGFKFLYPDTIALDTEQSDKQCELAITELRVMINKGSCIDDKTKITEL
jgi:hypothetical protein